MVISLEHNIFIFHIMIVAVKYVDFIKLKFNIFKLKRYRKYMSCINKSKMQFMLYKYTK